METPRPIIQNDRDQRVYDWLVSEVGEEAVNTACMNLAGKRKPYLSNIAKQLGLTVPERTRFTPNDGAKERLASIIKMLNSK